MSVMVRHLEAKDRDHWEPLFQGYLKFYESSLTDEMIEKTWQRLLGSEPEFHCGLVAVLFGYTFLCNDLPVCICQCDGLARCT